MSADKFRQSWPDPETDLRDRFGIPVPSLSNSQVKHLLGLFLFGTLVVITILELAA